MKPKPDLGADPTTPRPVDGSYWVVPGRLLVGEHPGARSRAQSMDRLRRFLESGITCFIDLTQPNEIPSYETMLPFETPAGRRVEYLREPIPDHGVPADRETMARILAMIDGALDTGHHVYLHCRAGIGRSAMAAGCWLAERSAGNGAGALTELRSFWKGSARSRSWPTVPETDEQARFVQTWTPSAPGIVGQLRGAQPRGGPGIAATDVGDVSLEQRVRGGWYGLALGDAMGSVRAATLSKATNLSWTQHTALTLCLAESLLQIGSCDARDQIERYWRWYKEGYLAANGAPGEATASTDVAKALATGHWRGQPMAGSHDPADTAATSLPRVLAAVMHAGNDPASAIALSAECSRTTHQSPIVLDACRFYGAMLVCGLKGLPAQDWLQRLPEPAPRCWGTKPLRKDVRAVASSTEASNVGGHDVLGVLATVRRIAADAQDFDAAIAAARRGVRVDAALMTALVGTVFGMRHGVDALPGSRLQKLTGSDTLERIARSCLARLTLPAGAT